MNLGHEGTLSFSSCCSTNKRQHLYLCWSNSDPPPCNPPTLTWIVRANRIVPCRADGRRDELKVAKVEKGKHAIAASQG